MRLSSQKDLLLIIIISLAVLIISWLQLIKGSTLLLIQYVTILLVPGYALITIIWPTNEKMIWSMRAGLGFVIGLFSVLFLPLILKSLNLDYISNNLTYLLLIVAILFSLLVMVRRSGEVEEEELSDTDGQLTLEESIERVVEMEERAERSELVYEEEISEAESEEVSEYESKKEATEDEYEYFEEEYTDESEETYLKSTAHPEEEYDHLEGEEEKETEVPESYDEKTDKYSYLKEEKPIQYERIRRSLDDEPDYIQEPEEVEHTKPSASDYEEEMYRPVWMEEEVKKKPGFKYWDLVLLLVLSGISIFLMYFNPQKTSTTSIILFVLLLFVLGYAGLTILFPDKSRVSFRILTETSAIVAVFLFVIAFVAFANGLLPDTPTYLVNTLFFASMALVSVAVIRKWLSSKVSPEDLQEEEPTEEEHTDEQVAEYYKEYPEVEEEIPSQVIPDEKVEEPSSPVTPKEKAFKTKDTLIKTDKPKDEKPSREILKGSKWEKALSIILIISLILAIATTVYIIVKPKQGEKFTEFYILGPDGKASNYPTNLTTGQNGSVIIGVVNHEYATTNYQLVVKVNGNTTMKNETITLTNEQKMEIPFNFTAGTPGEKKMEFLLYKLPDQDNAYRSLHLWLKIT